MFEFVSEFFNNIIAFFTHMPDFVQLFFGFGVAVIAFLVIWRVIK